ncbi:MAG: hypothetical protein JSW49_02910 [candidate division WOR-3 bacterium]|nr:MAG: hypothetical protein JSW49_02910 [candidate division WOR-3 bacterium]
MNSLILSLMISFTVDVGSSNGLYRAAVQYGGGSELITSSLTLYDAYDNVVYVKNNIIMNTFYVCDNGNVFALNEHRLCFYRMDGSEMLLQELSYPNGFGFSPDNAVFFASDKEGLFAYSDEGSLTGKYRPGRLFASTSGGGAVAIISADTLFVYRSGGLVDRQFLSSPYVHDVCFSDDGASIVIRLPGDIRAIYDTHRREWVEQK